MGAGPGCSRSSSLPNPIRTPKASVLMWEKISEFYSKSASCDRDFRQRIATSWKGRKLQSFPDFSLPPDLEHLQLRSQE